MAKFTCIYTPQGLDFDLVKVGRPCTQPRALALADLIHHQVQYRRKGWAVTAYQVDSNEVATPSRDVTGGVPGHRTRFLTGRNTRFVRVHVLTLGGSNVSSTPTDQSLILTSTTDSTGVTFAEVSQVPAPSSTIDPSTLQGWEATVEVSANTVEILSVEQTNSSNPVRVLSVSVEEMACPSVDTADDAVSLNLDEFAPGTDIIDTEYDDLPTALQSLRRFHKKILFHSGIELQTTANGAANRMDFYTRSTGSPPASLLQWDVYPSVNLPETSGIAVTCAVLATASASTATVRFAFGSGDIDVSVPSASGLDWFTNTGSISKSSDTLSLQGYNGAAATLTVYAAVVTEDSEAT